MKNGIADINRVAWTRIEALSTVRSAKHEIHLRRLAKSAGGFPAMTGNVPFLMKDVVLLAVSFFLFKQDLTRFIEQRGS